jgi:saccharopine dehydrogenase-like NADP-dependent oxidoreductase
MKKILVLGAGRSATTLIQYLDEHAARGGWRVTVADADEVQLADKTLGLGDTEGRPFEFSRAADRAALIEAHDLVISLLPWTMHTPVARDCLRFGRHLLTASYVSPEMKVLAARARRKGLFFMGELGLDPGLDHMSALRLIREIRETGGEIHHFHSYAGGLVAEDCDTNPWHYKFSWNPRNVVLAGQGMAQYRHEGHPVFQPYHETFRRAFPVRIAGRDRFEVYANRDSLKYESLYGLKGIPSLMRGTVRVRGFSRAWQALITLGLTEALSPLAIPDGLSWAAFIAGLLPERLSRGSLDDRLARYLGLDATDPVMDQLRWLGLLSDQPLGSPGRTAADYLQELLEERWRLAPGDRDLVVMEHRLRYRLGGEDMECRSSLFHEGRDARRTAMADLVGLPLAVTAQLFLAGHLPLPKYPAPFEAVIYDPVMEVLETEGVRFEELRFSLGDSTSELEG